MSAAAPTAVEGRGGLAWGRTLRRQAWPAAVIVLLAAMITYQSYLNPNWGSFDTQTLVIAAVPLAFAAMAQSVVIISGGVDLSVGTAMSLVSVIAARFMNGHSLAQNLLLAAALVVGAIVVGAGVGALIGLTGVPDIVVTLALSFVWLGVALLVLGIPGGGVNADLASIATVDVAWTEWIPTSLVVLLAVYAVVWIPLRRSRWGLAIYAIGSDRNAAYLSGVSIFRTRMLAYAVGGLFTAFAGLALTATTGIGDANAGGNYYTLNSVAASVLGGVSLAGGIGGLLGPLVGAFVLSLVSSLLLLLEVDPNYGEVIRGALIIGVVLVGGILLLRKRS